LLSQFGQTGATDTGTGTAATTGAGSNQSLFSANVMGFLISSQGQPTADTTGAATATSSPLGPSNQTTADAALSKMDTNGGGSVDPSGPAAARPHHHHHHHHQIESDQAGTDPASPTAGAGDGSAAGLANLLDTGGTSQTITNPDGSTTRTISYADGSTITMNTPVQSASATTSPTTAAAGQPSTGSGNSLQELIRLQAQLFATATAATTTV
jgi:hypothetical protein